jgi:STE24 endopeptidase
VSPQAAFRPQAILVLYLVLLALQFLWEQLLLLLNRGHLHRLALAPPGPALEIWGPQAYGRSVQYSLSRGILAAVSLTVGAATVLTLLLTGWLGRLETLTARLGLPAGLRLPSPLRGVLFVYAVSLLFALVELPLHLYSQFVVEQRFGFNRMSAGMFVIDTLKSLALNLVLITPLLYGLLVLVRATPLWWLWAFAAFAIFQLGLLYLYPWLIAPLFNRFTPLPEGSLRDRIRALAEQLGFRGPRASGIFVMDGSRRSIHSNAYFTGFGRARRIVLFDTLVSGMQEEQVAAVLAHEIGHARRGHVAQRLAAGLLGSLLGFWLFDRVLDYVPFFQAFGFTRASPQAALVLGLFFSAPLSFLIRPLFSWWSRRQEFAADRFAARKAGLGKALGQALQRLARDNLSNPTPHRLYSLYHASHPPVLERLEAIADLADEEDEEGKSG